MVIKFSLGADVLARKPDYIVGVVVARQADNRRHGDVAARLLHQAAEAARWHVDDGGLAAAWFEALREFGVDPAAHPPAVERLLERVRRGEALPSVNPAVDLANAVSLRYHVSLGVHDLEQTRGSLSVRLARSGDTFLAHGADTPEGVPAGEPVYVDERDVRTRWWVSRQSQGGRALPRSHLLFFPIDGFSGDRERIQQAAAELAQLLHEHLGARTAFHLLDRTCPECVLLHFPLLSRVPSGGDAIDELLGRGVVDIIKREEIEPRLRNGEKLKVKLGMDPTSSRVHLGRATRLFKLREFQLLGHTIQFVVGSFTGMLGDPSDKKATRQQLTAAQVQKNMASYSTQAGQVIDISKAELHYNADWLAPLTFAEVIELAANFTVQQMIERENFHGRYVAGRPIYLHELLYPLLQGQDSVVLQSDVELGGTDQLFNMLAGRVLQERAGQQPQTVITGPLIPGTNGDKMSSSEGNVINVLDSPRDQYFNLMRMHDDLIVTYFETCTTVPFTEVRELAEDLESGRLNPRNAKARLARTIVTQFHSKEDALVAEREFEREVRQHERPAEIANVTLAGGARKLADLVYDLGLVNTKAAARRLVEQGGVAIDGVRITTPQEAVEPRDGMVVRAGKAGWARVRVAAAASR
ncbi:MAG: tyrosine--tRNA ligase [Chloroflexi bacterium]|nr:tyrosine--tRNA ligase [Chloroflexota bacterium]